MDPSGEAIATTSAAGSKQKRGSRAGRIAKSNTKAKSEVVPKKVARRVNSVAQARACWRCKRYKKKCNEGMICDACITSSGFRVWPSTLGCRRGNLHTFAHTMVPVDVFDAIKIVDAEHLWSKVSTWRQTSRMYRSDLIISPPQSGGDIWDQLIYSMQQTHIYGPGVLELIQIATQYQRSQTKANVALHQGAVCLQVVLELYHSLVLTSLIPSTQTSGPEIARQFLAIRKATLACMDRFLSSCLTARVSSWAATFLSCALGVLGSVLLADIIVALPAHIRSQGWPNLPSHILDLRSYLYSMVQELLLVLAKDAAILDMEHWDPYLVGQENRNREGMRLVDEDATAFDAMVQLKAWRHRFWSFLKGDLWMTTPPLGVDLLIVMSLSRLFVSAKDRETLDVKAEEWSTPVSTNS